MGLDHSAVNFAPNARARTAPASITLALFGEGEMQTSTCSSRGVGSTRKRGTSRRIIDTMLDIAYHFSPETGTVFRALSRVAARFFQTSSSKPAAGSGSAMARIMIRRDTGICTAFPTDRTVIVPA